MNETLGEYLKKYNITTLKITDVNGSVVFDSAPVGLMRNILDLTPRYFSVNGGRAVAHFNDIFFGVSLDKWLDTDPNIEKVLVSFNGHTENYAMGTVQARAIYGQLKIKEIVYTNVVGFVKVKLTDSSWIPQLFIKEEKPKKQNAKPVYLADVIDLIDEGTSFNVVSPDGLTLYNLINQDRRVTGIFCHDNKLNIVLE